MKLDKNLTKADTSLALKNSIKVCKIFSNGSKSFIINAILICP